MSEAQQEMPRFTEAIGRLEEIAQALEEGELELEQSLAAYEEGVKLLRHCHALLERAERRVELLSGVDSAGNPVLEPYDDAEAKTAPTRSARRTAPPKRNAGKSEEEGPSLF